MSQNNAEARQVLKELRIILQDALAILDNRKEPQKNDTARAA